MGPAEVRDLCKLNEAGAALMKAAMRQLHLSARAYHRLLKLAHTTTDLGGAGQTEPTHIAEAVQYRRRAAIV